MAFRSAYKGNSYYILTDANGNLLDVEGKFTEKLNPLTRLFASRTEIEQHIFALRQMAKRFMYLRWKRLEYNEIWRIV